MTSAPTQAGGSHTKGPWSVLDHTGLFVLASGALTVAEITHQLSREEQEANAHLMAAAPELLQALQLLHDDIAEYQRINNLGGYDNHCMKLARAAIAAASPIPPAPLP